MSKPPPEKDKEFGESKKTSPAHSISRGSPLRRSQAFHSEDELKKLKTNPPPLSLPLPASGSELGSDNSPESPDEPVDVYEELRASLCAMLKDPRAQTGSGKQASKSPSPGSND